jgi:hypothetical protein
VRDPTRDQQRHLNQFFVERPAVEESAVLEELFAVVGGEQDDRVLEVSAALEFVEEAAQLVVDLADLGVVEIREVLRVGGPEVRRPERAARSCSVAPVAIPS